MSILEWFRGTEAEKAVIVKAEALEGKKLVKRRDRQTSSEGSALRSQFRRRTYSAIGGTILLAAGAATVIFAKDEHSTRPAVSSPAHSPSPGRGASEITPRRYFSVDQVRSTYDRGFNMIMDGVPDDPQRAPNQIDALLSVLKNLRRDAIRWAELKGDSIVALEGGKTGMGWAAIIPQDNPQMGQSNIVMASGRTDLNLLTIKPIAITPEWGGIIFLHELIHFYDRMSGHEPQQPSRREFLEGEVRAYTVEVAGIDRITNNEFSRSVRAFVTKHKISSVAQAFTAMEQGRFDELNKVVTATPAQSLGEQTLRDGLYMYAVTMEALAQTGLKDKALFDATVSMTEELMIRFGGGNHIPTK